MVPTIERRTLTPMEFDTAASTIEVTDTGVLIRWSDGARSRFHSLWLRDHCPANPSSSLAELNPDVFVMFAERNDDGELAMEFSDGHESAFDFAWLQAHSHEPHERIAAERTEHFRAGHQFDEFARPETGSGDHLALLESVERWGAAIVRNETSTLDNTVHDLFGPPRESIGLTVSSHLSTLASTRTEPDGIVIVSSEDDGCVVTLVDGFAISTELQDDDPDTFDVLSQTVVSFRSNTDPHLTVKAPVIAVDRDYRVAAVRFDEQSLAPLDIEPRLIGDYYRSIIRFGQLVNDPGRAVDVSLEPGQTLVVDNRRVLIARAAVGFANEQLDTTGIERDWFERRCTELRSTATQAAFDSVDWQ